jgi:bacterioferritin
VAEIVTSRSTLASSWLKRRWHPPQSEPAPHRAATSLIVDAPSSTAWVTNPSVTARQLHTITGQMLTMPNTGWQEPFGLEREASGVRSRCTDKEARMRGDPEIIEFLNEALTAELTAVNQYFLHAKLCEHWGYKRMAKEFYDESIGEMKDAESLMERILYLDGMPNLQRLDPVGVGETIVEQLSLTRETEEAAVARYNRGVVLARSKDDNGTRHLLEHLLRGEEEHLDWVHAQERILADIGVERYLLLQVHS